MIIFPFYRLGGEGRKGLSKFPKLALRVVQLGFEPEQV